MKRIKIGHINFAYDKNDFPFEEDLHDKLKIYVEDNELRKDRLYFVSVNDDDEIEVIS